jgi:hypothetical protein
MGCKGHTRFERDSRHFVGSDGAVTCVLCLLVAIWNQGHHCITGNQCPSPHTLNLYRRTFSNISKNFIRRIDQVTNMVSNSPAETQPGYQVSTPSPFTALAPPLFPSRPGTSILMDCHSEGSLTVDNSARRWTSNDMSSM